MSGGSPRSRIIYEFDTPPRRTRHRQLYAYMPVVARLLHRNRDIQLPERKAHHILELVRVGTYLLLGSFTRKPCAFLLSNQFPFLTIVRSHHTNSIALGSFVLIVSQFPCKLQIFKIYLHSFPIELHESILAFDYLAGNSIAINHLLLVTVGQLPFISLYTKERRSLAADDSIRHKMSRQVEIRIGRSIHHSVQGNIPISIVLHHLGCRELGRVSRILSNSSCLDLIIGIRKAQGLTQ